MMEISQVSNPQVGDYYVVRMVRFIRNGDTFDWPVVAGKHRDGKYGLDRPHYHIDWRFMSEQEIITQRNYHRGMGWFLKFEATEYFVPISSPTDTILKEYWGVMQYLRDHNFPIHSFDNLREAMVGCKMKDMICPHHGVNLTSCKPVGDVVTCPQHGLQWNIKTGELV